ncbi:MAG: glycerol kinase GlpK [Planctomycetota bacterium]
MRRAYREFPQHVPEPGWVEHDADEIRAALAAVLTELLENTTETVVALGITNQRETVFALNRQTGRAFGRGIVWQDRRTRATCDRLRQEGHGDWVRERTGLLLDPYFSASKMQWLLEHREGVAEAARQGDLVFATVDSLVLQTLCGGSKWKTDRTNASRTQLMDLGSGTWDKELSELFGVPDGTLPTICASRSEFGEARLPGGRRVPVLGMVGDQQSALFGQGCWQAGDLKTTYGTGCFLMLQTGSQRRDVGGGLLSTAAIDGHGGPGFAIEGSIFAGGSIVQWLRDGLGILSAARESETLARQVPDSDGVVLVPAFSGLGAPHWDPDARAALLGMTRGTGRAHVCRAALDAIAHQVTDLVELLRSETGLAVDSMRVDGGAVTNDLLLQLQADYAGVDVLRARDVESTAKGAAMLAAMHAFGAETVRGRLAQEPAQAFRPKWSAGEVARQRDLWRSAIARIKTR